MFKCVRTDGPPRPDDAPVVVQARSEGDPYLLLAEDLHGGTWSENTLWLSLKGRCARRALWLWFTSEGECDDV